MLLPLLAFLFASLLVAAGAMAFWSSATTTIERRLGEITVGGHADAKAETPEYAKAIVDALKRVAKKRQHRIRLGLPDALDLLVVSVEAGLGLDQAIQRVGLELDFAHPDLSLELSLINLELRAGKGRREALHNLAERTGVDDIASLVAMLVQTDKFGTSVAQSLRVHSETVRTKRRQREEQAAAKSGVKTVFPLVFCIFPALFAVTAGP